MSSTSQNQNPSTQKDKYSSQGPSNQQKVDPSNKVGNNVRKDEPTAQDGMKKEGGSYSSSDKRSAQSDNKLSNI